MSDDDDETLTGIDLHMWRVPPPAVIDRPSLLVRALSPAAPKRIRMGWIVAAIVLVNAAIAALLVIVLARPPMTQTTVRVQPAGDGSVDATVRDVLRRLDQKQRELERKLDEIEELRALVVELSKRVHHNEQQDRRKLPNQHETEPLDPSGSCDEVSCVLSNYSESCCTKFRARPPTPPKPSQQQLPDMLDREAIMRGMASVKARVTTCGDRSTVKGKVEVYVHVGGDGLVTKVTVMRSPEVPLGACVVAAVSQAVFERTHQGGAFSYPFMF